MMKFRGIRLSWFVAVSLVLSGLIAPAFGQVKAKPRLAPAGPTLRFTPQRIRHIAGSDDFFAGYGEGGQAIDAVLRNPWGLAVDASGNLFVGDRDDSTVRRIDAATGVITTVAGIVPTSEGGGGGEARHSTAIAPRLAHANLVQATSVALSDPQSVAVDAAGNIYIASTGDEVVYKVDPSGSIVLYAGQLGSAGYGGDGAAATSALLNSPTGLSLDSSGNLFIADLANCVVRRVDAVSGNIATVAGAQATCGNYDGDGGAATSASLSDPGGTAVDAAGNLYIADTFNNVVRKVDATTGNISTIVGTGTFGFRGDGGPAVSARLEQPYGLAINAIGELYIADTSNSVVRKVDAAGVITTVAGRRSSSGATGNYDGNGAPATSVYFGHVAGVALDAAGNLFISASDNDMLFEVDATSGAMVFAQQVIHTTATQTLTVTNTSTSTVHFGGSLIDGDGFSTDSSAAGACNLAGDLAGGMSCTVAVKFTPAIANEYDAQLTITDNASGSPQTVYLTGFGVLAPSNVSLSITPSSVPSGSAVTFTVGVTPGTGTTPVPTGSVAIVDQATGNPITTINLDANGHGTYTTSSLPAKNYDFVAEYQGDGSYDESASDDVFLTVVPKTVSISLQSSATAVNFGDSVTLTAHITSSDAITGNADFYSDGVNIGSALINGSGNAVLTTTAIAAGTHALQARYNNPAFTVGVSNTIGILVHAGILQFQPGAAYTVAGVPSDDLHGSFAGDGGPATQARFNTVQDVVVDGAGNYYVSDELNNVVRRVDGATGIITTYAGIPYAGSIYSTRYGGDGGPATSAYLDNPGGLALDAAGNLFICDYSNGIVRRVDAITKIITTIAGVPNNQGHNVDSGVATQVRMNQPSSVAFDKAGNLYIADTGNNLIRKVDTGGNLTTIAGLYGYFTSQGSLATQTVLNKPMGVTVDLAGNVIFSDTYNNAVRKIDGATGVLSTIAGNVYAQAPYGDGGPATSSTLSFPEQLAVDPAGNLFIADTSHNIIRRIDTAGVITTVAGINGGTSTGYHVDPAGTPGIYTPLAAPYGIAIDNAGALFVTDTFNQTVLKVGAAGALLFGPQAVGSISAAQTLTISNAGDVPITFGATPYTVTGDYAVVPGSGTCHFGTALAVGASCTVQVTFTPTSTNFIGGTISFNSSAANPPQIVHLTSNMTGSPATINYQTNTNMATYGDQVLLYAQVSGSAVPPTGTVTFFAGTTNLGSATLSSGVAYILTTALPVGNISTTAVYSGDAFYTGGTGDPVVVAVTQAATSTTLAVTSTSVNAGASVGFTATVSSPATVPITGTVTFLDGTTALGSPALAGDGTASLTTAGLPGGANSITARYNGNANIAGSVSSAINVQVAGGGGGGFTPDYTISSGPLPVVIHRGKTATVTLTITPVFGYTGTVHLGCGTLPSYATCSFSTEDVLLNGSGAQTVTWTISTTAASPNAIASKTLVVQNGGPQSLPTVMFAK